GRSSSGRPVGRRQTGPVPHTLVVFHAHPDDEALLTGGTMARAAAAGHRVVVVFATDGGAGLASSAYGSRGRMGPVRRAEARAAARVLGAGRVEFLGYADSGMAGEPSGLAGSFSAADRDEADERADVVTSYDPLGGYGHPDHVQVHRVGALAAALAGAPVLLEATVDRTA